VLLFVEKAMAVKPTFGFAISIGVNSVDGVDNIKSDLGFELVDLPSFFFLKYSIADT
jgi:hypothetical protein